MRQLGGRHLSGIKSVAQLLKEFGQKLLSVRAQMANVVEDLSNGPQVGLHS